MDKGLTIIEMRDTVSSIKGKELKLCLVPIRIEPSVYDKLVTIALDGNVAELKQTVEKLLS